jgi:disulfide bond formation protein DsbB
MESTSTTALADTLNYYLSLATLIGFIVIAFWAFALIYTCLLKKESKVLSLIAEWSLPIGFFTTIGGTVLTLFYSQVLMYAPCELCWFQRIFLYPQVVLFAVAWFRKENRIHIYTTALSIVGFIVATYHHFLQMGYDLYKPCSTAMFAVSCAKPSFIEFGFVSFPFMAVVLFLFIIVLSLTGLRFHKRKIGVY